MTNREMAEKFQAVLGEFFALYNGKINDPTLYDIINAIQHGVEDNEDYRQFCVVCEELKEWLELKIDVAKGEYD